ncbi:uncharacterized protein LOC110825975 [Carica papaya]|uniref:uncharacterized protein LOC110825975 n=1 Tax=Carica papaya TaxID=3649 RepID=UPI000B8C7F47|nr:uncharacterized protein LOC110825975 [Carica papaya]
MENRRKKSSSGEIFSFPSTPNEDSQNSDFEFGCLTPDSPSQDPHRDSPADHLFCNGRLLPHAFPSPQRTAMARLTHSSSRATSRTSSVSSKDSLMSSRSNSTNSRSSRSSSCSSARTSSSDNSERRMLYYTRVSSRSKNSTTMASKLVTAQLYGSSQRWQYITPVPVAALKREGSKRKNSVSGRVIIGKEELKKTKSNELRREEKSSRRRSTKPGPCRRFFRSLLLACKECHAMEPSRKDDLL